LTVGRIGNPSCAKPRQKPGFLKKPGFFRFGPNEPHSLDNSARKVSGIVSDGRRLAMLHVHDDRLLPPW